MKTALWAMIAVAIATTIGSFGPLFLKKASNKFGLNLDSLFDKNLLLGIFFYGISTLMFIPLLKAGELSVLYPIVALAYVWVCLLSVKFLGEKMNPYKWAGIALIILGVVLIGFGR